MKEKKIIQEVLTNMGLYNPDSPNYLEFLNHYMIFFKSVYDELKNFENEAISNFKFFLGDMVFSIGTDELYKPSCEFINTLRQAYLALKETDAKDTKHPFRYYDMYLSLQHLLSENNNKTPTITCFKEITLASLEMVGFDKVKVDEYQNNTAFSIGTDIIFTIDVISRINKYFTEFNTKAFDSVRQNSAQERKVITDNNVISIYITEKIAEFENNVNGNYSDSNECVYSTVIEKNS